MAGDETGIRRPRWEGFSSGFSVVLMVTIMTYMCRYISISNAPATIVAYVFALLTADFLSGLVHWASDRWISPDAPIFGEILVRRFRAHHKDPSALKSYDFVKTNSGLLTFTFIPLLLHLTSLTLATPEEIHQSYTWHFYIFMTTVFVGFANQLHQWSHIEGTGDLPWYVTLMRRLYIIRIQTYEEHKSHHVTPYDTHFCMTAGFLDYPLNKSGFWHGGDWILEKLIGYPPNQ